MTRRPAGSEHAAQPRPQVEPQDAQATGYQSLVSAQLLGLQGAAGNRAVAGLVAGGILVQRSPELSQVSGSPPLGAAVHKYKVRTGGHVVRGAGAFGTGIEVFLEEGAFVTADWARTDGKHVWVEWDGQKGYVENSYLTRRAGARIGPSTLYVVPPTGGSFRIYDVEARDFITAELNEMYRDTLVLSVEHLLKAEAATGLSVVKKKELIEGMVHKSQVEPHILPDPDLWSMAAGNLAKVEERVGADHEQLVGAGLITDLHLLKKVELSGAEFHKHGQTPFFLTFELPSSRVPDPRKLVYKPANLAIDRALFGKGNRAPGGAAEPSLAESLSGTSPIAQYTILPMKDQKGESYGYMEFVHGEGPADEHDLMGVYKSIAANVALSFIVGLEDVHEENVLLLKDRIQVIDMEATTGLFTKEKPGGVLDPKERGFRSQLWHDALTKFSDASVQKRLENRAGEGTLRSVPSSDAIAGPMRTEFESVLQRSASTAFKPELDRVRAKLASLHSRSVPLLTRNFFALIPLATNKKTLQEWRQAIDAANSPILAAAKGAGIAWDDAFLKALLKSEGTYDSLKRGEVPYYTRDLGSRTSSTKRATGSATPARSARSARRSPKEWPPDGPSFVSMATSQPARRPHGISRTSSRSSRRKSCPWSSR